MADVTIPENKEQVEPIPNEEENKKASVAETSETTAAASATEFDVTSEQAKKVKKQIEFYFSEANLRNDEFLKKQIRSDPEKWVTIEVLLKFNKLRGLTTDAGLIAAVMRTSDVIGVSPDGTRVRRKVKLEASENEPVECSIIIKKIPAEVGVDELEQALTALGHGEPTFIKFRKGKDKEKEKNATSSSEETAAAAKEAFVEFKTPEVALKVTESCKEKPLSIRDTALEVGMMKAWLDKGRDERDALDKFSKGVEFVSGTLLSMDGIGEGVSREDLRAICGEDSGVQFVDFERGQTSAIIRFDAPDNATAALAKFEEKGISGKKPENLHVLNEEEETKYKEAFAQKRAEMKSGKGGRGGNRGGRGGGRGGGGRGRGKRGRDEDGDGSSRQDRDKRGRR